LRQNHFSTPIHSPETVYQWAHDAAAAGGTLYRQIGRALHKRRRRKRTERDGGVSHERSASRSGPTPSPRARFGDWEADPNDSAKTGGTIAFHAESKSHHLLAAKFDNKSADTFTERAIRVFRLTLPPAVIP